MSVLLSISLAHALTLDEAVRRAGEVDHNAVVAELEWRVSKLEAAERWTAIGVTPSFTASRTFAAGSVADQAGFDVDLDVLNVPLWFDAAEQSAQARAMGHAADATALDAQYAAAVLYFTALAGEAQLAAAKQGEAFAQETVTSTQARVAAGLESELAARSARLGLLQAQAFTAQAEADLAIARASLARALQQDVDALEQPSAALELPTEGTRSPWIDVAEEEVTAAKLEHAQALAGFLPVGTISADSALPNLDEWALTLGLTWSFDGVAGPFLRERAAKVAIDIERTQLDQLQQDTKLWIYTAVEQARAAGRVAEAARAREALADESLQVGQARLSVGLASSLEVLRLQDDAAQARADRVQAELDEAAARLEARRLAGVEW